MNYQQQCDAGPNPQMGGGSAEQYQQFVEFQQSMQTMQAHSLGPPPQVRVEFQVSRANIEGEFEIWNIINQQSLTGGNNKDSQTELLQLIKINKLSPLKYKIFPWK